jgi:hypothetical protein
MPPETTSQFTHPDLAAANPPVVETPAPEATPAVERRLLAGKYTSTEELEKGYQNSTTEFLRVKAENDARATRIADLESQLAGRANPAEQRAERQNDPFKILEDYGLPVAELRAASRAEAREEFLSMLKPIAEAQNARSAVASQFKDFEAFERQSGEFLAANPEINDSYQRMLAVDAKGALRYAYFEYQTMLGPQGAPASASGAEQAAARLAAQVPNGGGGARTVAQVSADAEAMEAAIQKARTFGDTSDMRALWLGDLVPKDMRP